MLGSGYLLHYYCSERLKYALKQALESGERFTCYTVDIGDYRRIFCFRLQVKFLALLTNVCLLLTSKVLLHLSQPGESVCLSSPSHQSFFSVVAHLIGAVSTAMA